MSWRKYLEERVYPTIATGVVTYATAISRSPQVYPPPYAQRPLVKEYKLAVFTGGDGFRVVMVLERPHYDAYGCVEAGAITSYDPKAGDVWSDDPDGPRLSQTYFDLGRHERAVEIAAGRSVHLVPPPFLV